jgi:glycosyltransferase A (GT-A) superfamily protein (DUF2064 family)
MNSTLLVIAKQPLAGRVKTRLCPPCTGQQAAIIAEAALRDTLAAVVDTPADRRVVVLDGAPGPWLPAGFDVVPQARGGLGERLEAAFRGCDGPAFLLAMDTPQVTPALLTRALARLAEPGVDAVLGPTPDAGYWGVGFTRPAPGAFRGVPMSSPHTLRAQFHRLGELGLRTALLPALEDVDTIDDARRVASAAPATRFAAALRGSGHAADGQHAVPEPAA